MTRVSRWLEASLSWWLLRYGHCLSRRVQRAMASYYFDARVRTYFWHRTGVAIGEGSYGSLGMTVVDDPDSGETLVHIGSRVSIGPGVAFVANSQPNNSRAMLNHPDIAGQLARRAPVSVEDDAWIGANVTILPGVRIGRGAVIGGGAVVTHSVRAGEVAFGVPARCHGRLAPLADPKVPL